MPYSHTPVYIPVDASSVSMGANNVVTDGPVNSTTKEITLKPCLDPNASGSNKCVLSNNNLTYDWDTSGYINTCRGNFGVSSGKYYWEVILNNNPPTAANIATGIGVAISTDTSVTASTASAYPGQSAGSYIYYVGGTGIGGNQGKKANNNSYASYNDGTSTAGDIIGVAFDADTRTIWFAKNNTWIDGNGSDNSATVKGEIEAGTTSSSAYTGFTAGTYFPVFTIGANDHDCTVRFSSTDWSYSPPSGFGEITNTITGIGNYWTLNPQASTDTLSNGNLSFTGAGNFTSYVTAPAIPMSGKWYYEVKATGGDAVISGTASYDAYLGLVKTDVAIPTGSHTSDTDLWVIANWNPTPSGQKNNNSTATYTPTSSFGDGSIIMVAIDMDNKAMYFGNDGTWATPGSVGDPTSGSSKTNAAFTNSDNNFGDHQVMPYQANHSDLATYNFGATPFVYSPPTGYSALSTANITSGYTGTLSNAIVTANATEANIKSTTEGAHSFSNWISILYNRDASEQRIFYASDDSSNYIPFCDDGVLGKNSFPTLAGSNNWTGCAIATGASTGIATGTISHTNGGGDSTGAHGLTSPTSRFSILISSEATSSHDGWFWFHPAMTASNNMRLAQGGSEGQQSTYFYADVTSSNAVVKSAAPTGTYRYIVFAENDLVSFYSYANIAGTNKMSVTTNNKPEWMLWGDLSGGYGQYIAWNGTHNPYNPWTKCTRIHNISTNEITGSVDILANGFFVKEDSPGQGAWHQTNGQTTIGISIGTPFPLNNRAKS